MCDADDKQHSDKRSYSIDTIAIGRPATDKWTEGKYHYRGVLRVEAEC